MPMTADIKRSHPCILVIDDDRDIVETLKGNLKLDGYGVLYAFDGKTGLHITKTTRPDLITLDLNLPDIDGIKACQIIRREFDFPIILLTARDGLSDKVLGLECGEDDYLVKPFDFFELSARIKAILNRVRRGLVQERHEFKDLSINFTSKSVIVRGKEVKLTKTEFSLFDLFAAYPNEVLSRDFIQKQIGSDSKLYSHSRTLIVHVQRLRKVLEKNLENPEYIVTLPGVGYKLQSE
jgi:two-component system alkaline phosphatase synthesis response regulator PhoP/OmpR family response regulator RpaB